MAPAPSNPHQLSPLEKLMPRVYVRHIYCFPSTDPRAPEVLREGLAGTISDIPYLLSGISTSGTGQMDLALSEPYQSPDDLFSCEDLSSSLDYSALQSGNFPPAAFTVPELFPPDTNRPYPDPAPVFRARASLVKGGLLLCVAVHHSTTDITGFGALLKTWASHCRTGSSRAAGFDPSWLDRRRTLLLPSDDGHTLPSSPPPPFPRFLHTPEAGGSGISQPPPARPGDYRTGVFFFAQGGLRGLKDAANEHLGSASSSRGGPSWVSTADVLAALLWSSMVAAEPPGGYAADNSSSSTLSFPVNLRSRAQLDPCYLGAAFVMTRAHASLVDLLSVAEASAPPVAAISRIAAAHRRAVDEVDALGVRAQLAYLSYLDRNSTSPSSFSSSKEESEPPPPVVLGPGPNGISVVSWADHGARELDWGGALGGACEAVRLAPMATRRYPIVLPRVPGSDRGGGGLEVFVCFEKGYMERFARSWGVREYAVLRCMS